MKQIVSLIEKFSDEWFRFIVGSSVQLAIFLSVIGIIAFIFRKKSAKFLYFLWLIGLLRVLLPTNFDFLFKHSAISAVKPDFIPTIPIQEIILVSPSESGNQLSPQGYLFLFWLAGVMIFVIYWLFNYLRFRRMIRYKVRPFDLSDDLKKVIDNHRVRILTGPFIATPFVRGIFRPKIYLPENAHHWPGRELKAILYHELAHIQCKDLFLIVIQNAVQMIYFFHPLVWLANMQIFRYREKARDDLAIEKMGGNALAYGKYLLTSMDNAMEWQPMYSASHYFLQSKSFLYQRFEYILNRKEKIMNGLTNLQKGVLVGCLILGMALTVFQSDIRSQTEKKQQQNVTVKVYDQQNLQEVKEEIINGRKVIFTAFDEPPEPAGGFVAIQKNLVYPKAAKKAGKEGKVLIYLKIGADGKIADAIVGHSTIQDSSCEAAALEAVKSVTWKPAKKDGKPISVWVSVPVNFTLHKVVTKRIKLGVQGEIPPPPPPSLAPPSPGDSNEVFFVPYNEPPKPIGGFAAIQKNLRYSESARESGLEGTVVVYVFIDENGAVKRTKIVKSLGGDGSCDSAAVEALKSIEWIPAKQKDKNVGVWVSVPVKFKFSGSASEDLKKAELKLQKVEKALEQKEKLLKAKEDEKSAAELRKIKEELQNVQEKLREKYKELQKLNEKMGEMTKEKSSMLYNEQNQKLSLGVKPDTGIVFVPYDKPPEPEGGFKGIQKNLVYPQMAIENKIEGTVILYVQITEKGEVGKVHVQKSLGKNCDQAAIDAVKSIKWKPAKQKGKPVAVWVSVPVVFKLK